MKKPVSEVQISPNPKTTKELVTEIAKLELEVIQMEKHLLSLYKKAFDGRLALLSSERSRVGSDCYQMTQNHAIDNVNVEEFDEQQEILGSSIRRTHSSLSHNSAYAVMQSSPLVDKVAEAVDCYHSLPLKLLEHATGEASNSVISYNHIPIIRQTANRLSEEMVRCISAIYLKLSANSVVGDEFSSPAVSFASSVTASPRTEYNLWSPQSKVDSSLDLHSDVSIRGVCEEFSGPYSGIVEVLQIYKDSAKLKEIDPMLRKFRSLVNRLEGVNPSKLKHDHKLAFWINVHNSLVMHAFLAYGIPQIKLKRAFLLLKAAYNVGGQTVSVSTIQNYILGSRLPSPGQWFHWLLHPEKKFRTRDGSKSFATVHPEPLSYFALCCGNHSDPPVRVYTPHKVFQELIAARGEYMLHNYRLNKEQNKILFPKIVENYAKDSGLHPTVFIRIIEQILPADHVRRNRIFSHHWYRKGWKSIGWIPHEFSFRYQFSKVLLQ